MFSTCVSDKVYKQKFVFSLLYLLLKREIQALSVAAQFLGARVSTSYSTKKSSSESKWKRLVFWNDPDLISVSASELVSLGQVVPLLGRSAWASVPCVPKTPKQL